MHNDYVFLNNKVYANNTDNIEINFALRRKVNTNLNIDGTLITDPARDQGFPLGSEVIFNEGILSGIRGIMLIGQGLSYKDNE